MRKKIIQIFIPTEAEHHRAVMSRRVEPVKMPVFTDVLIDQGTGPDVDWMVWLELDTVSRISMS